MSGGNDYQYFMVVEVLDPDFAVIAELPRRWDVQGSDPLNLPGVCTVTVSMSDPIWTRHPNIIDHGNYVRYRLCNGLGRDEIIALMHIRGVKTRFIGGADWGDFIRTATGPTLHGLLNDFIVKHEAPPRQDASESRAFSWTSPPGEWYDAGDWATSIESAGAWNTHITNPRSGTVAKPKYQPEDWPDPKAEWIRNASGSEWQFFRTTVTIPTGGLLVKWFLTGDEIIRGFLDGDMVISRDEYENGYKGFGEYKTFLPAGTHYLSVMMRSKGTPGGDGVDAFLSSLCSLDTGGDPKTVLRRSKVAGWVCHDGLPPPGWNQAEILRALVNEAQDRGNDSANNLVIDFTAAEDTNGANWTTEISRTFRIGTKVLDATSQLCELGDFDIFVDPKDRKIKAYISRGFDNTTQVVLEPGRNLIGWEVDEVDNIANTAVIHYDGGWLEKVNDASVASHGAREVGISLGAIGDDETASAIALAHMESRKHARKRAGAADEWHTHEDDVPAAAIIPVQGCIPFIDFNTGDYIKVPNRTGIPVKQRVLSLTFTEDANTGLITFDPEFVEEDT